MATTVKISWMLTAAVLFCFTQSNAQAKKDSVHISTKKDSLHVSEYAKIVYSADNNRVKLLPKTKTQTVFYKNHVTVVSPSDKQSTLVNQQSLTSIHPTPIPTVTGQTILVGAPGKEYYYNPGTGQSFKKKN